MGDFFKNKYYKFLVYGVVLVPNLFVIILGIESFPLTCAPMFAHHINKDTDLYVFKFEGVLSDSTTLNLQDYYGKSERNFMRHFFGRAYGVSSGINPFSNYVFEDSKKAFQARMDTFFMNYIAFLKEAHNLSPKKIKLSIRKVDVHRNPLSDYELIGYYDVANKNYNYGENLF